jgi:hypothetical protein
MAHADWIIEPAPTPATAAAASVPLTAPLTNLILPPGI